jgi:dissimilatory sulfite reductase related protein
MTTIPQGTDLASIAARLDEIGRQVEYLAARQRRQEELFAEMTPILREAMAVATTRLDELEKKGYFAFGRELVGVGARVIESYSPEDVRALGDAARSILDTVKALTQPEALAIIEEASGVLQRADEAEPIGIIGMVRASGSEEVQRGMSVMMELLRHVGRGAQALADRQRQPAGDARREKLARATGSRRREAAAQPAAGAARGPTRPPVAPSGCAVAPARKPEAATVVGGLAFSADGHLIDPAGWTPALAESLASACGVTLDEARWGVVNFARSDFGAAGVSPNIRRITQGTGLSTRDLYTLFPRAPARTVAKIAGIPKPAGCLLSNTSTRKQT